MINKIKIEACIVKSLARCVNVEKVRLSGGRNDYRVSLNIPPMRGMMAIKPQGLGNGRLYQAGLV